MKKEEGKEEANWKKITIIDVVESDGSDVSEDADADDDGDDGENDDDNDDDDNDEDDPISRNFDDTSSALPKENESRKTFLRKN